MLDHVRVHARVYIHFYYVCLSLGPSKNVPKHESTEIYHPQLSEGSIVLKERKGRVMADRISKRTAALNSVTPVVMSLF
jgi:hypothetical protein